MDWQPRRYNQYGAPSAGQEHANAPMGGQTKAISTLSERLSALDSARKQTAMQYNYSGVNDTQHRQHEYESGPLSRRGIPEQQPGRQVNVRSPGRPYIIFSTTSESPTYREQARNNLYGQEQSSEVSALYQKITSLEQRVIDVQRDYHSLLYEHQKVLRDFNQLQIQKYRNPSNETFTMEQIAERIQQMSLLQLQELQALIQLRIDGSSSPQSRGLRQRLGESAGSADPYQDFIATAEQQARERKNILRSNSTRSRSASINATVGTPRQIETLPTSRTMIESQQLSAASADPFREIILELDRTTDLFASSCIEK